VRAVALWGPSPLTQLNYCQLTRQPSTRLTDEWLAAAYCIVGPIQILKFSTGEKYDSQDQDFFFSIDSHQSR